jgi:hypothetical protein
VFYGLPSMSLDGRADTTLTRMGETAPYAGTVPPSRRVGLRVREDVEELDVEAVHVQSRELGDPVSLLEAEDEVLAGVVDPVELIQTEDELRGLLPRGEERAAFNVVRTPEFVPLVEGELPGLAWRGPVLDGRREDGEVLVHVDLRGDVMTLRRGRARLHLKRGHARRIPARGAGQT